MVLGCRTRAKVKGSCGLTLAASRFLHGSPICMVLYRCCTAFHELQPLQNCRHLTMGASGISVQVLPVLGTSRTLSNTSSELGRCDEMVKS